MENIFLDIGMIILVATAISYIARLLKQPLIPAYILTGLVIGPMMGLIKNQEVIATLSEIGIAFLLFIVGLEIDFRRLKDVGLVSTLGGTIQVLIVFIFGYLISVALGFAPIHSFYLGLILAFSSTMVVVKILSDKRELDTLHGRIVLGILLMQDVIAILALSVLSTLAEFSSMFLLISVGKGFVLALTAAFFGHFIFPQVFKFAAKSQEFFFLVSVAVCFSFAILFHMVGFSIAIGAFVAGITLANLEYSFEIIGKVRSLKDFFAILFFVSLGMQLSVGTMQGLVWPLVILTVFVLVCKPLVIMIVSSLFGYKKRTSFISSVSLAQISEFSLIIVALGMTLGQVSDEIVTISILLAIITITITSYTLKYEKELYDFFAKMLNIFETLSSGMDDLEFLPAKQKRDVVLCGYDRTGYSILRKIKELRKEVVIVDFNPDIIKRLIREKVPCIYGDMSSEEIIERIGLERVKLIISTIPDVQTSHVLIKKARAINRDIIIFVTAYQVDDALDLYDTGADYVILPHFLGGEHVSLILEDVTADLNKLLKTKVDHIRELHTRRDLGHHHPQGLQKSKED
ncbi:cation:proton antiporter [Candidatus Woesearchaeota archaeon]|nr:cation:proton antiporter [Candidatus Woesearchaeota archaeon]